LPITTKGILNETALTADFVIEEAVLEAEGICPNCKEVATP
jgi:Fe2+ or Zn2+ uptake regulation protein